MSYGCFDMKEMWWDRSCNWSAALGGYSFLGMKGWESEEGESPLCAREVGKHGALPWVG